MQIPRGRGNVLDISVVMKEGKKFKVRKRGKTAIDGFRLAVKARGKARGRKKKPETWESRSSLGGWNTTSRRKEWKKSGDYDHRFTCFCYLLEEES